MADVVINDNRWSIILFFVHSPPLIKRNCRLTSHTHHKNQCPHKQCCNRNVFEEWQINSLSKSFPQVLKIGRNINTYDTFSNMLCLHSDQCYLPSSMFFADNVIIWLMLTWLKNFLKGPWNLKLRNKSSYLLKLPALLQQLRRLLLILLLCYKKICHSLAGQYYFFSSSFVNDKFDACNGTHFTIKEPF